MPGQPASLRVLEFPRPDAAAARQRPQAQRLTAFMRLNLIATSLAWAYTSMLALTFAVAALSPGHRVLVTVNEYGEMGVEAVVLAVTWAVVSLNTLLLWKHAWGRARE